MALKLILEIIDTNGFQRYFNKIESNYNNQFPD